MALQQGDGEASQPTEVVTECSFSCATVVLAKIDIEHPMHGLDAPMSAHRFAESFSAEIATQDVILDFTRFAAVQSSPG